MTAPDDRQSRFASLDRRTYLRLQAAGLLSTGAAGVGSANSHEPETSGWGEASFSEGGWGGTTTDSDPTPSPPDHSNSRFSSTSSSSSRYSSATSADYDL